MHSDRVEPRSVWQVAGLALALAVASAALFSPALRQAFFELDDAAYVSENPLVASGLAPHAIGPLLTGHVAGNWHPVTMLSHALDVQLFGMNPAGHHATSVALHAVNTALVFVAGWRLTGAFWTSALWAALFGWHPQRVESVAWIASRKDLMSALFALLMLCMYPRLDGFKPIGRYLVALGLLALGLMAKPMLVTWPFVLLLLDYWPRGRTGLVSAEAVAIEGHDLPQTDRLASTTDSLAEAQAAPWNFANLRAACMRVMPDKLPMLALSGLACWWTVIAQAPEGIRPLPLGWRLGNAVVSYGEYMRQACWPNDLAYFYPHPAHRLATSQIGWTAAALVGVTLLVWWERRLQPYLAVGWCWFLGMMVPVIGAVQVGGAARADRYTYLPSLGLGLMVCWSLKRWVDSAPRARPIVAVGSLVLLIALAGGTWRQLGYWQTSRGLLEHTLRVTEGNFLAHQMLGQLLAAEQPPDNRAALAQFEQALAIMPYHESSQLGRAWTLRALGQLPDACDQYRAALADRPGNTRPRLDWAEIALCLGRFVEARNQFRVVVDEQPGWAQARLGLAWAEVSLGHMDQAIGQYQKLILAQPPNPEALRSLAWLYATYPQPRYREPARARQLALAFARTRPDDDPEACDLLAAAEAAAGRYSEAATILRRGMTRARQLEGAGHPPAVSLDVLKRRLANYDLQQPYLEDPAVARRCPPAMLSNPALP